MKNLSARGALVAAALLQLTCNQAILTAPSGATIQVFANPAFIAANGDVSVISALVIEPAGTVVPDGTVVQFFTTLGRIEEQGRTNDGVARVNLVSDTRSGTATVTAISGGEATGGVTTDVVIGSARPVRLQLVTTVERILQPRFAAVVATVFDENGNPVANVPVVFTVQQTSGGEPTELMESRGAPVFTDNNGQARDEVVTSYPAGDPSKTIEVTATAIGDDNLADTVPIQIN